MGVAAGDASGAFASSSAAAAREEDARAGAYGPPAGALSASLEEGPALAPARGRLATGARLAHGFRPGRVVSRSRDGAETRERETTCLLYTSPSPRDGLLSRMPSSA